MGMLPSSEPKNTLRCRGLIKHYGEVAAVAGLDLDVRSGECFGMLGPNGAGKTTTVEIFEGLRVPDAGDVEVLGERRRGDGLALRARLGIQLQETKFPEKLTVSEVVTLFRSFYPRGLAVGQVLTLVGLVDKGGAQVRTLSGGQKQRLSLGCALVGDPELLFLDEPTTGLDPQSRRQTWDIVESLKARGRTVLLTTHYMEEAARLCDRVAVVDHGKVIALGTPRELIASLGAEHVIEFAVGWSVRSRFGVGSGSDPDLPPDWPGSDSELAANRRGSGSDPDLTPNRPRTDPEPTPPLEAVLVALPSVEKV